MPKLAPESVPCPHCAALRSRVVDVKPRPGEDQPGVYRRRCCSTCGHRFSTQETLLGELASHGRATDFARRAARLPEEARLALYRVLEAFEAAAAPESLHTASSRRFGPSGLQRLPLAHAAQEPSR